MQKYCIFRISIMCCLNCIFYERKYQEKYVTVFLQSVNVVWFWYGKQVCCGLVFKIQKVYVKFVYIRIEIIYSS